jgi:hypothetical protein
LSTFKPPNKRRKENESEKSAFLKSAFQYVNFVWEALICAILGSESQKLSDEEKLSPVQKK